MTLLMQRHNCLIHMANIYKEKDIIRQEISLKKKKYTYEELYSRSMEVLDIVEITSVFQDARSIFIYNALEGEVQTYDFIRKWEDRKKFYLPVVVGEDIVFRSCSSSVSFTQSPLGIMEPVGEDFTDYHKIDLIILPGVAFDRDKNRMGRGKGFYDRFLPQVKAPKMGICFEFQLLDKIPVDRNDIKMDYIVSENDFIW